MKNLLDGIIPKKYVKNQKSKEVRLKLDMLLKCINNIEVLINNTINIKHNVNLYIKPELSSIIKDSFNPIKIENIQTLFDLDNEFYYNKIKSIKSIVKALNLLKEIDR